MSEESMWIERAQSAEARLATLEDQYKPMKQRIQEFKNAFGVREDGEGKIHIDFEKFATALGIEQALELRKIIDETYNISGEAGEKPRVRLHA